MQSPKARNLGLRRICLCLQIRFPKSSLLLEDHQANILSTADGLRHHCKLGGGSASIPGTSVYRGGSSDGQNDHSRIVLPPETGEQLSL